MALLQKALQRKRENKKKKRGTGGKKELSGPSAVIAYENWSPYECWVPVELWGQGLGQVIIARKNTLGSLAVGIYLIDTYCLGIKDCFVRLTNTAEYRDMLEHVRASCGEMELVEPSYANTLIIKASQWASQFGFKPHSDFTKAKNLLKDLPIDKNLTFSFGQDGIPIYIQGPHESPVDVKRILKTLESIPQNKARLKVLNKLSEEAQKLGMGYDE